MYVCMNARQYLLCSSRTSCSCSWALRVTSSNLLCHIRKQEGHSEKTKHARIQSNTFREDQTGPHSKQHSAPYLNHYFYPKKGWFQKQGMYGHAQQHCPYMTVLCPCQMMTVVRLNKLIPIFSPFVLSILDPRWWLMAFNLISRMLCSIWETDGLLAFHFLKHPFMYYNKSLSMEREKQ